MNENTKEEFLQIYKESIKREGADKLLDWLLKADFFCAPASGKYHSCFEGGLCFHSLNVYKRLLAIVKAEYGEKWEEKVSKESVAICGLLHDLCKVEFYKTEMRNVKVDGVWKEKPYYAIDEKLPYGHGEKSVYIINGFLRLTREEALAINWHMGGFDSRVQGGSFTHKEAFYKVPLCVLLHIADLEATFLDEKI